MIQKTVFVLENGKSYDNEIDALKNENILLNEKISKLKQQQSSNKVFFNDEKERLLNKIPMKSGVYLITNMHNFKKYVGSSKCLKNRMATFFNFNIHYSSGYELEEDRKKYSNVSDWQISILEICSITELCEKENYYINVLNTINNGYNVARAKRNKKQDLMYIPQNEDIDYDVINQYRNFIALNGINYTLGKKLSKEEKKKLITLKEFNTAYKNLKILHSPGNSRFTLHIKYIRKKTNIKKLSECLSIIPDSVGRIINSTNCTVLDENGIPDRIIKKIEGADYMVSYNCVYSNKYNIPTTVGGFKTKYDAYLYLLKSKTNICRNLIQDYKNYIDDETYTILMNLTYKESAILFFGIDKNNLLSDEIIPFEN